MRTRRQTFSSPRPTSPITNNSQEFQKLDELGETKIKHILDEQKRILEYKGNINLSEVMVPGMTRGNLCFMIVKRKLTSQ
jgi:hypothetical protein